MYLSTRPAAQTLDQGLRGEFICDAASQHDAIRATPYAPCSTLVFAPFLIHLPPAGKNPIVASILHVAELHAELS